MMECLALTKASPECNTVGYTIVRNDDKYFLTWWFLGATRRLPWDYLRKKTYSQNFREYLRMQCPFENFANSANFERTWTNDDYQVR